YLLDANAVAQWQGLRLGRTRELLVDRQAQEREDLTKERLVSGRERPAEIDLLQERQQSLRAEGERTEHWKRKREPAFARGYHNCQHRDEDHAKSLDHEARRGADEGGARFRRVEAIVDAPKCVEIHGLRAVDDHVPDPAEAFLKDFHALVVRRALDLGILRQAIPREDGNQKVNEREPGCRRNGRE